MKLVNSHEMRIQTSIMLSKGLSTISTITAYCGPFVPEANVISQIAAIGAKLLNSSPLKDDERYENQLKPKSNINIDTEEQASDVTLKRRESLKEDETREDIEQHERLR